MKIARTVVIAPSTCRKSGQNGPAERDHHEPGFRIIRTRRRASRRRRCIEARALGVAKERAKLVGRGVACGGETLGELTRALLMFATPLAERAGERPEDDRGPDPPGADPEAEVVPQPDPEDERPDDSGKDERQRVPDELEQERGLTRAVRANREEVEDCRCGRSSDEAKRRSDVQHQQPVGLRHGGERTLVRGWIHPKGICGF